MVNQINKRIGFRKKNQHEEISGSNPPPKILQAYCEAKQYGQLSQYDLLQQWNWVLFTFERDWGLNSNDGSFVNRPEVCSYTKYGRILTDYPFYHSVSLNADN